MKFQTVVLLVASVVFLSVSASADEFDCTTYNSFGNPIVTRNGELRTVRGGKDICVCGELKPDSRTEYGHPCGAQKIKKSREEDWLPGLYPCGRSNCCKPLLLGIDENDNGIADCPATARPGSVCFKTRAKKGSAEVQFVNGVPFATLIEPTISTIEARSCPLDQQENQTAQRQSRQQQQQHQQQQQILD